MSARGQDSHVLEIGFASLPKKPTAARRRIEPFIQAGGRNRVRNEPRVNWTDSSPLRVQHVGFAISRGGFVFVD